MRVADKDLHRAQISTLYPAMPWTMHPHGGARQTGTRCGEHGARVQNDYKTSRTRRVGGPGSQAVFLMKP